MSIDILLTRLDEFTLDAVWECARKALSSLLDDFSTPSSLSPPEVEEEVRRRSTLYLALFKSGAPGNLVDLLLVYSKVTDDVKKFLHRSCLDAVKAVRVTDEMLLSILEDVPVGAESLIRTILLIVTENTERELSAGVIQKIHSLFLQREKDVRFLVPIVSSLQKADLFEFLTLAVTQDLPIDAIKVSLLRLFKSSAASVISHQILFHLISLADEANCKVTIPIINFCVEETDFFTSEAMASLLQQLLDTNPWSFLLMRVVSGNFLSTSILEVFSLECILSKRLIKEMRNKLLILSFFFT